MLLHPAADNHSGVDLNFNTVHMSLASGKPGAAPNGSETVISNDERNLPERQAAAKAMNRLSHAIVRHRASSDILAMISAEAEGLADTLEKEPEHVRELDFVEHARSSGMSLSGGAPLAPLGEFVDMFHDSPVSGSLNPLNMGLKIATFEDHTVGRITLAPGWQGAPGRAHGGVVAAVVDEVLGAMLPVLGVVAFTGELTLRYVAPCPLGVPLEFTARATGRDGRKIYLSCVGVDAEDAVFVEATSIFIQTDVSQFEGSAAD